jgi:hypothetical protein
MVTNLTNNFRQKLFRDASLDMFQESRLNSGSIQLSYLFDVSSHGVVDFKVRRFLVELSPEDVVVSALDDQVLQLANGGHALRRNKSRLVMRIKLMR